MASCWLKIQAKFTSRKTNWTASQHCLTCTDIGMIKLTATSLGNYWAALKISVLRKQGEDFPDRSLMLEWKINVEKKCIPTKEYGVHLLMKALLIPCIFASFPDWSGSQSQAQLFLRSWVQSRQITDLGESDR